MLLNIGIFQCVSMIELAVRIRTKIENLLNINNGEKKCNKILENQTKKIKIVWICSCVFAFGSAAASIYMIAYYIWIY